MGWNKIDDNSTRIYAGEGTNRRGTGCISSSPLPECLCSMSLCHHLLGEACQCTVHPDNVMDMIFNIKIGSFLVHSKGSKINCTSDNKLFKC